MIREPLSSKRHQRGVINLGGIGVVLFLIWCFWVAMAPTSQKKLDRVCSPVSVTGNLMVSLAALAWEPSMPATKRIFDQTTYGCKYMSWRLVYERRYKAWLEQQQALGNVGQQSPWAGEQFEPAQADPGTNPAQAPQPGAVDPKAPAASAPVQEQPKSP